MGNRIVSDVFLLFHKNPLRKILYMINILHFMAGGKLCCFFSEDMVKYLKVCISKENRGIKYNGQ